MKGALLLETVIVLLIASIMLSSYLLLNINLENNLNKEIQNLNKDLAQYRFRISRRHCRKELKDDRIIWSCSNDNYTAIKLITHNE